MNTALRLRTGRPHHQLPRRRHAVNPSNGSAIPFWGPVVIRLAAAGDRSELERLAQLDSAELLSGMTLIGEVRGRAVAALALGDGREIADPFAATGDVLELLRVRARQLMAEASWAAAAS